MGQEILMHELPIEEKIGIVREQHKQTATLANRAIEAVKADGTLVLPEPEKVRLLDAWRRNVRFPYSTNLEQKLPDAVKGMQGYGIQLQPETIADLDHIRQCSEASVSFADLLNGIETFDPRDFPDWVIQQQRDVLRAHGASSGIMYYGRPEPKERYYPYLSFAAEHLQRIGITHALRDFLWSDDRVYMINLPEIPPVFMPHISQQEDVNCKITQDRGKPVYNWRDDYSFKTAQPVIVTHYVAPAGRQAVLQAAFNHLKEAKRNLKAHKGHAADVHIGLFHQRNNFAHLAKNGNNLLAMQGVNLVQELQGREPLSHQLLDFIALYTQPEEYARYFPRFARGEVDHYNV